MNKALALPTTEQLKWQDMELGMFIHWAPNVYRDLQGDDLSVPPEEINPQALDTEQWADVAMGMGAKYVVLVAKHIGGFCLWQTETSKYGIKDTPWRGGRGDVVDDLSESCRKRGLKLGFYISPFDKAHGANVGGVCYDPDAQQTYNAMYRQQITELLTRYGKIEEVWFDGNTGIPVGDLLSSYAPSAMVFQSPNATIRWVGNEEGIATYPAWNAISEADAKSGVSTNRNGDPCGDTWIPIECDTTIRAEWFWSTKNHTTLKSLDQLMDIYYGSVGNGAVLLLNANPDRDGRIPEEDAVRARELGDEIRKRFSSPIAETSGCGSSLELNIGTQQMVDHIAIMEDIAYGERIRSFTAEGCKDGQWLPLASGTAIGHKRILRIEPIAVSAIRLTVLTSAAEPRIRSLVAYHTGRKHRHAPQPARPESIVVGEWGPEFLWCYDGPVKLNLDLTGAITSAGQYRLSCVSAGGEVEVASCRLLLDGTNYPQYVSAVEDHHTFLLFVAGVESRITANIILTPGNEFRGSVLLERL